MAQRSRDRNIMPRQGTLAALFDMDGVIVDNMAFTI